MAAVAILSTGPLKGSDSCRNDYSAALRDNNETEISPASRPLTIGRPWASRWRRIVVARRRHHGTEHAAL